MNKGIIYYTHNTLEEPIFSKVQQQILKSNLPIVSCSLKSIDFGENIVLDLEPGVLTMCKQILTALKRSTADTIFFCEHDVLYSPTHFNFDLPSRDKFYYNTNVWRWFYPTNRVVTWESVRSLSGLCVDREFAIKHYELRIKVLEENGWRTRYGFEPGCRKIDRGGITDDEYVDWKSELPNIDIRHWGTITPRKCHETSFARKDELATFKKIHLSEVPGWDYKFLKSLCPISQ